MLGGQRQVELNTSVAPPATLGKTVVQSFEKPFLQGEQLFDYILPGLSTEETRRKTATSLSMINESLSDPRLGWGQQAANMTSELVGSLIPTLPLTFIGGQLLGAGAKAIGIGAREIALEAGSDIGLSAYLATQVPISKLATSAVSHYLPQASIGGVATGLAESYGAYKGFTIPEHFAEHYNAVNNILDSTHAIEDWAADNYGFLLGGAPLAAGYIAFKGIRGIIKYRGALTEAAAIEAEHTRLLAQHGEVLKANEIKAGEVAKKEAQVSELQNHLQQAEERGDITPEYHQWYLDYLENPNDPKVHEGGLKVLQQLQIPYDRFTGKVWHQVLSNSGIKNLKSAMFDEAITNLSAEENQLLSQYIVHNELDAYISQMRDHPELLQAIQGMTHSMGIRIDAQAKALREFDASLEKRLSQGLKNKELMSQENIYEHLKSIGVYSHKQVPYEVPRDVIYKLSLERRLKKILSRATLKDEQMYQEGIHHEIKQELKQIKLTTPQLEINELKDKLLSNGRLIKNYNKSKDFYRLQDLSQVWPQAKVLLDRINMQAMHEKQAALNNILKQFTDMVDKAAASLAKPDDVTRYLSSRIEKAVPSAREFNSTENKMQNLSIETAEKTTIKPEIMFDESSMEQVSKTKYKEAQETFELTEKKYKQFSQSESALNDLIVCALGEI